MQTDIFFHRPQPRSALNSLTMYLDDRRKNEMNTKILLFFIMSFLIAGFTSFTIAQVPASQDTIVIPGGASHAGLLEATINGDTTATGARIHPNRVYRLQKNQIYTQYAAINIKDPTGTLTIVGEQGGTKPIIILKDKNGKNPGMNTVQGSIKLDNLHMQGMIANGIFNNNLWVGTTLNGLPQSVNVNNCLFEFINLDTFSCDGYTEGAKFRFTNSYFRNLFHKDQWWGSRVFYCKQPIDTIWVENCTVTSGGILFLNQNALTKFAYFNHNTIVNNKKYWLKAPYFVEFYVCNNIFINQNWSGEDWENTIKHGDDPDTLFSSTIDIDSVNSPGSTATIKVQPEYYTHGSPSYTAALNADKMKVYVSNNIYYNDTLLNRYYTTNAYNTLGRNYPISYLTWFGKNPPYRVVNVPCAWMNDRTKAMFAKYPHNMIEENTITDDPHTVTPGIKDASVADQMAKWNAYQWGVPGYTASTNDILHSSYIYGDYDPTTIPGIDSNGVKMEDAGINAGIAKFTDLNENFSQSVHISTIDNLPIGSLIWDDNAFAHYNSADDYQNVIMRYINLGGLMTGVKESPGVAHNFNLSQNYPNPFNPSTVIKYHLSTATHVRMTIFDMLGREVRTLLNEQKSAGSYQVSWNASGVPSGVYFYRLQAGSFSETKKLILLK
jgi:hypothetical protein